MGWDGSRKGRENAGTHAMPFMVRSVNEEV